MQFAISTLEIPSKKEKQDSYTALLFFFVQPNMNSSLNRILLIRLFYHKILTLFALLTAKTVRFYNSFSIKYFAHYPLTVSRFSSSLLISS